MAGTKEAEYCLQHAPDGMVNVSSSACRTESCGKRPSFGGAGTKTVEYCAYFASNGMVDACSKDGTTGTCGKEPSFENANTRTAEYCAQNVRLKCCVNGYKEREVDLHHCGKMTVGNVIQSGGKRTAVHSLVPQASPPSVGSRGSRKRARYPEITSTVSKLTVARESTGGAVTMPDIDEQKSPVKQNSSMKTEVQLFY